MPQIFRRRSNLIARLMLLAVVLVPLALAVLGASILRTSSITRVGIPVEQPVPFSHAQHVGDLKLDCRYCHTSVESAAFAGMPSTETCMTCHYQIKVDSPALQPIRDSFAQEVPVRWNRVTSLPDYVYFDHHAHVANGIGCTTCHGPIGQMSQTYKAVDMRMSWCLSCHREPGPQLRPSTAVFDPAWPPAIASVAEAHRLGEAYQIHPKGLDNCSVCHR